MKKIALMILCLALVGFVPAFAAENVFETSGEITVGANSADDLTVGMSPKVIIKYINPGTTDATAQWFSIATAHPGGSTIYATAQNLNNIYTKDFVTGTALTTGLLDIPGTANSASDWSDNGWEM